MHGKTVGFIGLGSMGEPMARNLLQAGYTVRVWNRTPDKADGLLAAGAQWIGTPREAAQQGLVLTMVANDAALEAVTLGEDGIVAGLAPGGVHVSMSTVSPQTARRLAAAHEAQGSLYLAAPVFGRPQAAAAAKLWICESGPAPAKTRAAPVLAVLGQGVRDFGEEPGAAHVAKLCGNFLILSAVEAMGEAFALAEKSGLDRSALASFFAETLFACPIYQGYGPLVAERRYVPAGFRLPLGLKDMKLVQQAAEDVQVPMTLASLLYERLLGSLAKGREELDWTAIELITAENAGLTEVSRARP